MKFTFIYGPNTLKKAQTARRIYVEQNHMLMHLDTPVREALLATFYNNDLINYDLNKMKDDFLPFGSRTVGEYIDLQKDYLREQFGQNILGRIALKTFRDMRYDDLYTQILFPDCDSLGDVEVFEREYPKQCYTILTESAFAE
jgi:hypothetical protein